MDAPKLTSVTQKLKDYSSLVVPSVLVLVAIGIFIPAQLMSNNLKKRIEDESIHRNGKQIRNKINNTPASDQWKEEQKYQLAFANDVNQIVKLAEQSGKRQLLSYAIFPDSNETSTLIYTDFGSQFRRNIEALIESVNAGDCPTEVALQRSLQQSTLRRKRSGGLPTTPAFSFNRRRSTRNLSDVEESIVEQLCTEKAETINVYINPIDLSGYEFWEKYEYVSKEDAVEDCWYWQLGYWIIEDVIGTIGAVNAAWGNVLDSPTKRILKVSFNPKSTVGRTSISRKRRSQTTDDERPAYLFDDGSTESLTGRFTSEGRTSGAADIDVVRFEVTVVISADGVLPFMRELCSAKEHKFKGFFDQEPEQNFKHNQITILESKINPIDLKDDMHNLYRYGEKCAVLELNLICEYIFSQKGYDQIKPESVKKPKSRDI